MFVIFLKLMYPISIHASAKEATLTSDSGGSYAQDFNPRFREGSDSQRKHKRPSKRYFNPRFREGSDCFPCSHYYSLTDFNPRFREGSDQAYRRICQKKTISIHASAKEATLIRLHNLRREDYFNPRFREGSDNFLRQKPVTECNFNPRFREGSDKQFGVVA